MKLLLITPLLFCLSGNLLGQNVQKIDLAKSINETINISIEDNKQFEIIVENKLPSSSKEYTISIARTAMPVDVLSNPSEQKTIKTTGGGVAMCAKFIQDVYSIYDVDKEENIPAKVKMIRNEIKEIEKELTKRDTTDDGCMLSHIQDANGILELTTQSLGKFTLKKGEQLEVIITRVDSSEKRTWIRKYSTESRGSWRASYGLSFIPQIFNKEELYFSSPNDSSYTIKKENKRSSLSFAPSIFFTWMPTENLLQSWSLSWSGGLGYDFANPTAYFSISATYNQNLVLHLGLVFSKQKVLLGKYSDQQIIKENLSEEQLHEEVYKLNPFIGISFRFGENPFRQNQ